MPGYSAKIGYHKRDLYTQHKKQCGRDKTKCRLLVKKPCGKSHLENPEADGRITLKIKNLIVTSCKDRRIKLAHGYVQSWALIPAVFWILLPEIQ